MRESIAKQKRMWQDANIQALTGVGTQRDHNAVSVLVNYRACPRLAYCKHAESWREIKVQQQVFWKTHHFNMFWWSVEKLISTSSGSNVQRTFLCFSAENTWLNYLFFTDSVLGDIKEYPTCTENTLLHRNGLNAQVKGVDGEHFGDVVALLLIAHVGAADSCLPQTQVAVRLRKHDALKTWRQLNISVLVHVLSGVSRKWNACNYQSPCSRWR